MPTDSTKLRIATYNIRRDSQPNEITILQSKSALGNPLEHGKFLGMSGEYPWSTRRLRVAESLLSENITIAGFQEALERQVNDLAVLFGNGWGWVGRGRSDVKEGGEYCPIFYKKSTVNLLSSDTFWLSDTPSKPSKTPGGGTFPVCTMASFRLKNGSKTKFTVFNAHLDLRSDAQRRLGASLILARARYEAVQTHRPVFVMGDFNSISTGKDSGAYTIISGANAPVAINSKFDKKYRVGDQLPDFKMHDLRDRAPRKRVSNNFATYTGFNKPCDTSGWKRIGWTSRAYKVGTSLSDDGILASDHRPVFADVSI